MLSSYSYVGLDVHEKTISHCVKRGNGEILDEGVARLQPPSPGGLDHTGGSGARRFDGPWHGGMEATLSSGWVHEALLPYAETLKVGHPYMPKAISASKRKNDRLDARTLADVLRCDLFPQSSMPAPLIRELHSVLRYRTLLVREATRLFPAGPRIFLTGQPGLFLECTPHFVSRPMGRRNLNLRQRPT